MIPSCHVHVFIYLFVWCHTQDCFTYMAVASIMMAVLVWLVVCVGGGDIDHPQVALIYGRRGRVHELDWNCTAGPRRLALACKLVCREGVYLLSVTLCPSGNELKIGRLWIKPYSSRMNTMPNLRLSTGKFISRNQDWLTQCLCSVTSWGVMSGVYSMIFQWEKDFRSMDLKSKYKCSTGNSIP